MQYVSWYRKSEEEKEMKDFSNLSKSDIDHLIDEWIIGRNSERDRKIVKRRLIDGICYEPLAEEFDLSVRQVKNIVYKSVNKIYNHIIP